MRLPSIGITLGAIYGTLELSTAVTGKDWVSGREVGTGERWFRGLLAPLDLIPVVGSVKKFSFMGGAGKLKQAATISLKTSPAVRLKETVEGSIHTARLEGLNRMNQLKDFTKGRAIAVGKKLERDIIDAAKGIDKGVTAAKQLKESVFPKHQFATPDGAIVSESKVENTHAVENFFRAKIEDVKGIGKGSKGNDTPAAFRQTEFASSYEARLNQTPSPINPKVGFEGTRGESNCILKPPPDTQLKKILDEAGVDGIEYKNGVPDFSPVAKAEFDIDYMLGGNGSKGTNARRANFAQADQKLADQLNNSPNLARKFGMEADGIKARDIERYRERNKLTWHELNDVKTIQLVPTKINKTFGHLGGVGEINAGAFGPGGFAKK